MLRSWLTLLLLVMAVILPHLLFYFSFHILESWRLLKWNYLLYGLFFGFLAAAGIYFCFRKHLII